MSRPDAVSRVARALHVPPTPLKTAVAQAIPQLAQNLQRDAKIRIENGPALSLDEFELRIQHEGPPIPAFWMKGQLLNVRNAGADYVITVLGEEFDPRYPERALRLSNYALCQDFISRWYQRESHDPRAR